MTKTKAKRQTVGDCEQTLRALEAKRERLIDGAQRCLLLGVKRTSDEGA